MSIFGWVASLPNESSEDNTKKKQENLLTVEQLAAKLNIKKSWIYQRTRLGQTAIPHIKVGKYVRFDLAEVMKFLEKQS